MNTLKALIIIFALHARCAVADKRCTTVSGRLECVSDPKKAVGVDVWLKDYEGGFWEFIHMDRPDVMAHTTTDDKGRFEMSGCASDLDILTQNHPDPYVSLEHSCNSQSTEVFSSPVQQVFHPDALDCGTIKLDDHKKAVCEGRVRKDVAKNEIAETTHSEREQTHSLSAATMKTDGNHESK